MGIFKNKEGKPSKFATIAKGLLMNPTVRTLVPFGNVIGAATGVMVVDKEGAPGEMKEISNPLIRDIVQAIVTITPLVLMIIELLKD